MLETEVQSKRLRPERDIDINDELQEEKQRLLDINAQVRDIKLRISDAEAVITGIKRERVDKTLARLPRSSPPPSSIYTPTDPLEVKFRELEGKDRKGKQQREEAKARRKSGKEESRERERGRERVGRRCASIFQQFKFSVAFVRPL